MAILGKSYYWQVVDKVKEAERCRELWLAVIEQTIRDSCGKKEAKRDIAKTVQSQWWHELFVFAGLGEREKTLTTAKILANLAADGQKKLTKRKKVGIKR